MCIDYLVMPCKLWQDPKCFEVKVIPLFVIATVIHRTQTLSNTAKYPDLKMKEQQYFTIKIFTKTLQQF